MAKTFQEINVATKIAAIDLQALLESNGYFASYMPAQYGAGYTVYAWTK